MYGHTNPTIRKTDEGDVVGPKMHGALQLAAAETYPSKNALAKTIGPNGSQRYGYEIVNRCISKGLLTTDTSLPDATPQGIGAVVVTDKGKRYLEAQEDGDDE